MKDMAVYERITFLHILQEVRGIGNTRNQFQLTAFEQAEMILYAALDPAIASRARQGNFVKCLDHFNLLQTARN
jgi:hypothetical protein